MDGWNDPCNPGRPPDHVASFHGQPRTDDGQTIKDPTRRLRIRPLTCTSL